MNIHIFYNTIFGSSDHKLKIGGVQKYIYTLGSVLISEGYEVFMIQESEVNFHTVIDNFQVFGYKLLNKRNVGNQLFNKHRKLIVGERDLIIWGSELISIRLKNFNTLSIQHGMYLDYVGKFKRLSFITNNNFIYFIYKVYKSYKTLKAFNNSNYKVCVDYNFLNWTRTLTNRKSENRIFVIPNFTKINQERQSRHKNNNKINILFARRFEKYRGTRLMSNVISAINSNYDFIDFTFAGNGPDLDFLKDMFKDYDNVKFTEYGVDESLRFHSEFDIAIIPTIAMEGTSLSLLEAMSAGCAVIATNIGGLSNILINGYNGLLIMPDFELLKNALIKLIENESYRLNLGQTARKVAEVAFGYDTWKGNWISLIKKIEIETK